MFVMAMSTDSSSPISCWAFFHAVPPHPLLILLMVLMWNPPEMLMIVWIWG